MIETNKLSYEYELSYQDESKDSVLKKALDNININIKSGEFIAILGHNGSGKSTLAKHINGLLLPTSGVIYINGKETSKEENLLEIRQIAGMVFQNPDNQIIGSVVEEDVGFGLENLGVETSEIWDRVEKSLKKVDMFDFRKVSPNKLSGGQKQKVAIASVLAMQPKCIVLDEPTAMLDPIGRKEVIDTAFKLNKEAGVTIVLITHFMEEVVDADRVIIMEDAKIVLEGKPREIFLKKEELTNIGLDIPDVTKISMKLIEDGIDIDIAFTVEELVSLLDKYRRGKKFGN